MTTKVEDYLPKQGTYIPIHTSDRGTFKRCRRRWSWTSPIHSNLRVKSSIQISFPLWFGTGIHWCLEEFYNPVVSRDPFETWNTWYHSELNRLQGSEFLNQNIDVFDDHYEMGLSMMRYYRDYYAPKYDDFELVASESKFAIPLGFDAIDPRDGGVKPVYVCGKRDAIVYIGDGRYAIIDHKTHSGTVEEDYFTKLDLDEQCSTYLWATQMEAEMFDLPWKNVDYVIYNVLEKGCIRPPSVLKSGKLSINRQQEFTTAELFTESLTNNKLWSWYEQDEKAQHYLEWLETREFCTRRLVRRSQNEIENTGKQIGYEASDMLAPDIKFYPSPSPDWYCTRCPFRAPCLAVNDGSDYEYMLNENYETNMVDGDYTI